MTNFTELQFPAQMRPELARHIAETLCWAPGGSTAVGFTALSLLYASWQASAPATLEDFLTTLKPVYLQEPSLLLETLKQEEGYANQALLHGVGPLTTYHVKQAVDLWSEKLDASALPKLAAVVSSLFTAAIVDDSDRTESLASTISDAIDAMTPDNEEDEGTPDGIMIMGPTGPLGPFVSVRAAQQYMVKAMRAHMSGKPLPPLPPFPGQETLAVDECAIAVPALEPGPGLQVYSREQAKCMVQRLPPPAPGEGNMQQRRLLEAMAAGNGWRMLTVVPDENPLAEMYDRFPHFSAVLDFVAQRLALAGCGEEGKPVRISPILLRGVHGTGKSYFAKELARVLGTYYVEKDLSVTTEAFVISGMDSGWKGSKPGIVFDALVNGKMANPLICLNEIDKASARGGNNSPVSALYSLLEQESSMNFTDEFVPVAIDASRVIWVCTANDGDIPAPILERLEVFDIKEPTKAECRTIATSVWSSICASVMPLGHGFPCALDDKLLEAMSAMRPRVMRKTLTSAAGKAAVKGLKFVTLEDLATSQKQYEVPPARSIGFVQHA